MNTLSEFTLHINKKNSTAQRHKIIYAYDECLVSEAYMLGGKVSCIRDAKLKCLIGFKMQ